MGAVTGTDRAPAEGYVRKSGPSGDEVWSRIAEASSIAGVSAYNSSAQAVGNNSTIPLSFDSERYDTDGIHSVVTNPTRLTVQTPGLYYALGVCEWAANSSGYRSLRFRKNGIDGAGGGYGPYDMRETVPSPDVPFNEVDGIFKLNAGDYLELMAHQNSGGSLNVLGSSDVNYRGCEFHLVRLGDASGLSELPVPGARAFHNTTQPVANTGAWIEMALNQDSYDNDNIHDTATNNPRLIAKTAGRYLVHGQIAYTGPTAGGVIYASIRKNGVTTLGEDSKPMSSDRTTCQVTEFVDLAVGDYVSLYGSVYEASGGATAGAGDSSDGTHLEMVRIGRSGGSVGGEAWITPALAANVSTPVAAGYSTVQYYKDPNGVVHLKGTAVAGASITDLFTLPIGYRPSERLVFTAWRGGNGALRLDITSGGLLQLDTAIPNGAWVSLDGITFRAA